MNDLRATRQGWARLLVGKRILIVESDFFIAGLMADDLTEAGAKVLGPADGPDEALALLQEGPRPDGVILDVDLQNESVLDLAALLQRAEVAVVLSSILSRELVHADARRAPLVHKAAEPWEISRALFALRARSSRETGGAGRWH